MFCMMTLASLRFLNIMDSMLTEGQPERYRAA